MKTIKSAAKTSARFAFAFAISLSTAAPVHAGEWGYKIFEPPATYTSEFDLRFWYGMGSTKKNLFDDTGALLLSRLNYSDLSVVSGEAVVRFDFNNGWFVKGYGGGGGLFDGKLKDEDFGLPPPLNPYSATISQQKFGSLGYFSADAGANLLKGPDFRLGAFVGYHFLRETVSAYGCGQIADNPLICGAFPIPDNIRVITQVNNWQSLRVGVDAAVEFDKRWKFSVDAAWLPYVHLSGTDAHWLRIGTAVGDFTGPVPEDGNGWGYQLEGVVSYRVNDWFSLGVGGRYWHAETSGHTHFEGHVVGLPAVPQVVDWRVDNFGGFLQASFRLGPNALFGANEPLAAGFDGRWR